MNTVQLAAPRQSRTGRCVRSSSTSASLLPQLETKFGERAFGPSAWNALPTHIRDAPNNSDSFRKRLKTRFLSRVSTAALMRDIDIAVLSVCLSVCLSHSGIVSKRLNISSYFLQHMVVQSQFPSKLLNFFATFRRSHGGGGVEYIHVRHINLAIFDQYLAVCWKRYYRQSHS